MAQLSQGLSRGGSIGSHRFLLRCPRRRQGRFARRHRRRAAVAAAVEVLEAAGADLQQGLLRRGIA